MTKFMGDLDYLSLPIASTHPIPTPGNGGGVGGRKLAIVGNHSATRHLAPFDDLEWEIWLFNEAAQKTEVYTRWDGLLQIHGPEVYTSPFNWVNKDHWEWLQQDHGISSVTGEPKRIWMQEIDPRVPNSVKYPLEEVLKLTPHKYLRSSPALALALAIYLGYEHIRLYGSELTSNTEYAYQAPNYAYWIGFAEGRGIDLELCCWQSEFDQRIYGYDGEFDIDREFFRERFSETEQAWKTNDTILKKTKDRIDQAMLQAKFDEVAKLILELESVALTTGETAGSMAEAERYSQRENPISRQEFERRGANAQNEYNQKLQEMYHVGGKVEYLWNVWRQTGRNEALNQLRMFLKEKVTASYDCGAMQGTYRENMMYMQEYDARLTAAGWVRALRQYETQEKAEA